MGIFEGIVVFVCAWWLIFLPMLSAGTRSQHEGGSVVPGTERGAPQAVGWRWKVGATTLSAGIVTFVLWLALRMHWLDFMMPRL